MTEFEMLLACYRSGQVSERQWQEHLKDPAFREWVEDQSPINYPSACSGRGNPAPQPSGPVEALVKALEPFAKHGNASCDYVEISSKHLRAARRAYLDACEVLWCETCGERPQEARTEHAGLCHECWISEGGL